MDLIVVNNRIATSLFICVLFGGVLFGQRVEINQIQIEINQLKIDLSETTDDSTKARIYNEIAVVYRQIDIDSALYYFDKSISLIKKSNIEGNLLGEALLLKVASYTDKGAYSQALKWAEQALSVGESRNDSLQIAFSHLVTGNVYLVIDEYEKALANYQQSLEILTQTRNTKKAKKRYSQVLYNLGDVYFGLKEYEKALEYFETFRKIAFEIQETSMAALSTVSIGEVYLAQGKIDTAITLFNRIITTLDPEKDKYPATFSIIKAYDNLAKGYYEQKHYKKALSAAEKAVSLGDEYQLVERKIDPYKVLTKISIGLKDYIAAINYAQKGIDLTETLNVRGGALPFYQLLSEAYGANNQLTTALAMERKYSQLNDSLNQLQVTEKIANLEFTAEIKQKEAENALLKEEKKNQDLTIQQKKYAILAISTGQ